MAEKVTVDLVDDLDGDSADETVEFALDGVEYRIDLSNDNAIALRDTLSDYIENGRRKGGRKKQGRRPGRGTAPGAAAGADREQNQAIRKWARKRGLKVSDRGRISADIVTKYHQAK